MNHLLDQRTRKEDKHSDARSKMAEMAKQSASGHLTSFSGVFSVSELCAQEKDSLKELLYLNAIDDNQDLSGDLDALISLTSELKAINNQAALLHGERIKKAQHIFKKYREGAFTAWLINTYGNRQTPYNFLYYYEFYNALAFPLRRRMEEMPRQAVYTLASRNAPLEKKQQVVEGYRGETKTVLLESIRKLFPLEKSDNRRENFGEKVLHSLDKVISLLEHPEAAYSEPDKEMIEEKIKKLQSLLRNF